MERAKILEQIEAIIDAPNRKATYNTADKAEQILEVVRASADVAALLAADRIEAASLLAQAIELLRTEHLECEPEAGCGRCDTVREFLERAAKTSRVGG